MSTPNPFFARSRTWPKLDFTVNPSPKNPSIVLAFAGDSTITKFLLIYGGFKRVSENLERVQKTPFFQNWLQRKIFAKHICKLNLELSVRIYINIYIQFSKFFS